MILHKVLTLCIVMTRRPLGGVLCLANLSRVLICVYVDIKSFHNSFLLLSFSCVLLHTFFSIIKLISYRSGATIPHNDGLDQEQMDMKITFLHAYLQKDTIYLNWERSLCLEARGLQFKSRELSNLAFGSKSNLWA